MKWVLFVNIIRSLNVESNIMYIVAVLMPYSGVAIKS